MWHRIVPDVCARLEPDGTLVATDLNQAMLEYARAKFGPEAAVEWKQADATDLPFDDQSFDAVVCQFGLMFFPDKERALCETYRVLKPGGVFLFSVWDGSKTTIFRTSLIQLSRSSSTTTRRTFTKSHSRFTIRNNQVACFHSRIQTTSGVSVAAAGDQPIRSRRCERFGSRESRDRCD